MSAFKRKRTKSAPTSKFEVKQLIIPDKPLRVKSIPLLLPNNTTYNPRQGLTINKDVKRDSLVPCDIALELLNTIQKPVAVLSIAGPTRSGKSYILSRFLGDSTIFELGHTMRAHTKGIWMSTYVLDCSEYCILLLDTEGIDSVADKTSNDAKILVSTLLLSSYFIYNSKGVPHNNDLEKMSIFVNMAKTVVVRQGEVTNDYWRIFPPFLWLLRDVTLGIPEIEGKNTSPTEYLETEVFSEDIGSEVCKALRNFFPSFVCETLPSPSVSVEIMKHVAENKGKLYFKFNEGVKKLITYLQSNVKPKKVFDVDGGGCDGPILAELVSVVAEVVNNATVTPAIDNTWRLVVESRCMAVHKSLLEQYSTAVEICYEESSKGLPIEEMADSDTACISVMGIHKQVWGNVQTTLHSELSVLLSTQVTAEYNLHTVTKQLEDQIVQCDQSQKVVGGVLFIVAEKNRKRSWKFCNELFVELYGPIKKRVAAGRDGYTATDLEADIESLFHDYNQKAIGPEKWQVRKEMEKTIEQNQEIFAKHLEELMKHTQAETEAREMQESLRNELQSLSKVEDN